MISKCMCDEKQYYEDIWTALFCKMSNVRHNQPGKNKATLVYRYPNHGYRLKGANRGNKQKQRELHEIQMEEAGYVAGLNLTYREIFLWYLLFLLLQSVLFRFVHNKESPHPFKKKMYVSDNEINGNVRQAGSHQIYYIKNKYSITFKTI